MNIDFLTGFFAGIGVMYLYKLVLLDILETQSKSKAKRK